MPTMQPMAKKNPAGKLGRPLKPDKFDAFLSFPCYHWHGEVLEAYRVKYGLRSKGEAVRRIIEGLAEAKGVKK